MEQRKINPWKWQDQFAFSQGIEVSNASRILYCAGQASVDGSGNPVHVGDMRKQIEQAFQNLETVLRASGFELANVVRLNYYTTDVEGFLGAADIVGSRLGAAGCQPSGTLLGVTKLAFPGLMIEMEATAAK
jgi:enamine deaminase RidA (YjgF/YER057c/UK114 family)